jgi:hypothetical protein
MNTDILESLQEPSIMQIEQTVEDFENELVKYRLEGKQILVVRFRGDYMKTWDGLYQEFGAALQLPSYFGKNLNALRDCLIDLGWFQFKAIVFGFTNSDLILSSCSSDSKLGFGDLITNIQKFWNNSYDIKEAWGHSAIPCHVLFQSEQKNVLGNFGLL